MKSKKFLFTFAISLLMAGTFVAGFVGNSSNKTSQAAGGEVWSMIGTPNWSTDTDLTYNANKKFVGTDYSRYETVYTFEKGNTFKIRKDKAWSVTIGWTSKLNEVKLGADKYLEDDGTNEHNLKVKTDGTYLISVVDNNLAGYGYKEYGFAIAKYYTITIFDGSETLDTINYEDYKDEGAKVTYTAASYPKEGKKLEGLYTDSSFENKYVSGTAITGDKILYAKYEDLDVENGYYLLGTANEWTPSTDFKLEEDKDVQNQYLIKYTPEVDEEFKIARVDYDVINNYFGYDELESGTGSAKGTQMVKASESTNIVATYSGEYSIYFKSNSGTIWISSITEVHTYSLTVSYVKGSFVTKDYEMEENSAVTGEYMSKEDVQVYAGATIVFKKDGKSTNATARLSADNNCKNDNSAVKACLNMKAKVYVRLSENDIFCAGLSIDKYGLVINGDYVTDLTYNEKATDKTEYYALAVSFKKDDNIEFVSTMSEHVTHATVFCNATVNASSIVGFSIVENKLMCTKTTDADIYVTLASTNVVYFGITDNDAAIQFAKSFNFAFLLVCDDQGATDIEDLQEAWETCANKFKDVKGGAKTVLKTASSSSKDQNLIDFAERYDYIYGKYNSKLGDKGGNFADRTVNFNSLEFSFMINKSNLSDTSTYLVVVLSSTMFIGLLIILKKKKARQ